MASAVAELETGLQAMSSLKAPGVSGTRIASLTALCVANVQSESVLIQKLYTHFKKTDGDHKLGVLYVVDSVTRKWLEQAKAQGQPVDGSARDGTFAAGVHRVTELMPVLINDIAHSAPSTQKEKILKLLDIWDKGQTFPQSIIESFRTKIETASAQIKSTTPEGSPPPGMLAAFGLIRNNSTTAPSSNIPSAPAAQPPAQNSNAIMEALANLARQNNAPPGQPAAPAHVPPPAVAPAQAYPAPQPAAPFAGNLSSLLSSLAKTSATPPQAQPQAQPPSYQAPHHQVPSANGATYPLNGASYQYPPAAPVYGSNGASNYSHPPAPAPAAPTPAAPAGSLNPDMQQQVMLIKALADQGVPFDKIPALIQTMQAAGALPPAGGSSAMQPSVSQSSYGAPQPSYGASQGWNAQQPGASARSPDRYGQRSRSRSPGRRYEAGHGGHRDGFEDRRYEDPRARASEYRQRSPIGRRQAGGDPMNPPAHRGQDKWVEHDRNLPADHIRVFSRTLFVGGVMCTEKELREIFGQYGEVQTCIVNRDKRHAFVKMVTRKDAITAKEAMEFPQGPQGMQFRTRWGVGFGPRQCSDYATGISVIPIKDLTDADRKWMLTAEYGGSGGQPIEGGLVVEEPDIEIGAGVSSKAISRRMQTDKSGSHGPRSTRTGDGGGGGGGWGRKGRKGDDQASGANAQPLVPQDSGAGMAHGHGQGHSYGHYANGY